MAIRHDDSVLTAVRIIQWVSVGLAVFITSQADLIWT